MRRLSPFIITIVFIIIVLPCCSSGDDSTTTPENQSISQSEVPTQVIEFMSLFPVTVDNIGVYDLDLPDESDEDGWEEFYDDAEDNWLALVEGLLNINIRQVRLMGIISKNSNSQSVALFRGDFDTSATVDKLSNSGFTPNQYNHTMLWQIDMGYMRPGVSPVGNGIANVAIVDDDIVIGNSDLIKNIIDVVDDSQISIIENENFIDVVNELPETPDYEFHEVSDESSDIYEHALFYGCAIDIDIKANEPTTGSATTVIKYENESYAQNALSSFDSIEPLFWICDNDECKSTPSQKDDIISIYTTWQNDT